MTVFVLGAGASKELGLPTGDELKSAIARDVDIRFKLGHTQESGSYEICEAFRALARKQQQQQGINNYIRACWKIRDALPQAISIDNFIDARSDDPLIAVAGKLGIATSILAAEAASKLAVNPQNGNSAPNFSALSSTWHNSFFQLLTENCKREDLPDRLARVALVVFNYDRCVEVFLLQALKNYYTIDESEALQLLRRVEIHHPYGVVGGLPGLSSGTSTPFGTTPHPTELLAISNEIKTFTEGTDESASHVRRIRELMSQCHRTVFLGFAYHRLNMQLLYKKPSGLLPLNVRNIYGTALSLSASDVGIISHEISRYAETDVGNVQLRNDLTCHGLFREYWRSMALN
ncbi:hypothetical protein AACH10_11690 [Ideonella sp. DXS22W]|uniref:SIR2-like domain-containing protein n=1 Tax=Pseudaquabacterium inlustre TaxID=2984192 RepID=A0ABU9CIA0_9BURK